LIRMGIIVTTNFTIQLHIVLFLNWARFSGCYRPISLFDLIDINEQMFKAFKRILVPGLGQNLLNLDERPDSLNFMCSYIMERALHLFAKL
jgi:hypothetical protein